MPAPAQRSASRSAEASPAAWRRRLAGRWRDIAWPAIGILWSAALILGYIGFARNAAALGQPRSPLDLAYLTLQLIPMNSGAVEPPVPWELNVARLLVPALAAYTLWRAAAVLFREQLAALRLWRWRDHVVICGLSRKGWLLARGFLDRGERVVVIEEDEHNDLIEPCRERGAVVLLGDATDPALLHKAAMPRARRVIAVTADDGVNAEIAVRVQALAREASASSFNLHPSTFMRVQALAREAAARQPRRDPLTCTVHLVDPRLCELARARELSMEEGAPFRLELFNVFESGGRLMWEAYRGERDGAPEHILVVGLGRLGESLVVHAVRERYWRADEADAAAGPEEGPGTAALPRSASDAVARLRITVIDEEAGWKCRALEQRYPKLAAACDLAPLEMDVRWPEFEAGAFLEEGPGYPAVSAIFVCFDDDSLGLATALALGHRLRERQVPVIVRMAEAGGLAALIQPGAGDGMGFANLHAFGLLDHTCSPEVILGGTHQLLARAIHEGYVRRGLTAGETLETNPSLAPWEELPEDLRQSNFAQADFIGAHLHALGYELEPLTDWDAAALSFSEEEVERLAQMEHERFVAERLAAGWLAAPDAKDLRGKASPSLGPWADLPEDIKERDRATVRRIPQFLAGVGWEARRGADLPD